MLESNMMAFLMAEMSHSGQLFSSRSPFRIAFPGGQLRQVLIFRFG